MNIKTKNKTNKGNTKKGEDTKHDETLAANRKSATDQLEAEGLGVEKTEWSIAETERREAILAEHGVSDDPGILDSLGLPSPAAATGGTDESKRGKRIPAGTSASGQLAIHLDKSEDLFAASRLNIDDEATETVFNVLAGRINTLAKKVREKAVNLVRHRSARDSVQVYTRIAMDQLISSGEMTSKGLQATYAKAGYSPGTQAAQSNQIMSLFPALMIADRPSSDKLVLRDESQIVADYRKSTGTKANAIGASAANRKVVADAAAPAATA